MAAEESKDPLKDINWKNVGSESKGTPSASNSLGENGQQIVRKRLRKKFREIPESYFLPRRSWPVTIAFYGSFIVAGVGAGMLAEIWINKKVKEDGGVIWEFDK
ncbi:uncharacterized protein LOC141604962 [Silene latifolia]|uniref:uncharacterized protein LOC141604962 n=1 Tax=Silene latifolia TaxID=37657 RepID=UPI003D78B0DA